MTLEEAILSKFKSIRAFATAINVPYTTIKGALERGISGTSIQTGLLICKELDIDIESLVLEEVKFNTVINDFPVTTHEKEIVMKYRCLNDSDRATVDLILNKPEYSEKPKIDMADMETSAELTALDITEESELVKSKSNN